MPKTKVEVYDKDQLIYPFIESDHVTFSNGMKVSEMLDQSISMPKVIHEDLSFKVGVGDQDVSSAIVDSSVAKMTIKGKTYQNILPEPSTHVLTNNKEMFKVNEGLDPNVEIVDGVAKSAILKGQTLNNIALTINNTIHKNAGIVVTKPSLYDMTKRYIVMFDVVEKPDTLYMKLEGTTDGTWKCDLSSQKLIDSVGRYYLISNVSSVQHKQIKLTNTLSSSERCIVTNVNVVEYQEGMENWDIPYFEGMQSVKMPVLTTTGSNVFDGDNSMELGAWSSNSNPVEVSNEIRCKNKHTPFPNGLKNGDVMRIVLSDTSINSNTNMHVYDENKTRITTLGYGTSPYIEGTDFINGVSTVTIHDVSKCKYFSFRAVSTNTECKFAIMVNTSAPYESYKTNILSCNEEVVLRGIGNVGDTLNLLTGELTQRIGEVVFDGSEDENWHIDMSSNNVTRLNMTFKVGLDNIIDCDFATTGMLCDRFIQVTGSSLWVDDVQGIGSSNGNGIKIGIPKSNLTTQDVNGFKTWLSQNHVTVQYQLKTPTIKTVDLSSSGNWEKIVLDGSESWQSFNMVNGNGKAFFHSDNKEYGFANIFSDKLRTMNDYCNEPFTISGTPNNRAITVCLNSEIKTLEQFKQYLSQNPITVWYQTTTSQANSIKEMLFFKDGHIIQSSGADNSLIPTLDYQAKTSNSYVMDLMKTNTKYTMKAKSANGTFTIDGTSYGAGTNRTFTTPSSMTNKFLVMSNKTNEEVMILEGDVVSKAIPYFKGIKSTFEDESKIEVLSTGKNLIPKPLQTVENLDINGTKCSINEDGVFIITGTATGNGGRLILGVNNNFVKPFKLLRGKTYIMSLVVENDMTNGVFPKFWLSEPTGDNAAIVGVGGSWVGDSLTAQVTPTRDAMVILGYNVLEGETYNATFKVQLEESSTQTSYEPYKSNSTKIPLLSPLRSLPNGVCDELIIDRENNKAKIIQRVGEIVFDGSKDEGWAIASTAMSPFAWALVRPKPKNSIAVCDKIAYATIGTNDDIGVCIVNPDTDGIIRVRTPEIKIGTTLNNWQEYLRFNPMKVQYELGTPIITEVDLEGFPYIYKDGYIFLNSEIVPITEITYSINQCQQISASNEDIIRHEKELTYLQKLIAQYVQVDYESALLSLKV